MAVKIFKINGKIYHFYIERFDKVLIIDKIRNFRSSITKVEKEERSNKDDEFYTITAKIYIDENFVRNNLEKLKKLDVVVEVNQKK